MRRTYDVYFEEHDSSVNHKILEADSVNDIIQYLMQDSRVKMVKVIRPRKENK